MENTLREFTSMGEDFETQNSELRQKEVYYTNMDQEFEIMKERFKEFELVNAELLEQSKKDKI